MKSNSKTRVLVICALAVVINVVFGSVVSMLSIPLLFLDTLGTIFIASTYGMLPGILTGVATNLLMGAISGPTSIPFALVNVAVAIVVALMAKNGLTLVKAVITGVLLAFICPLIGAPIRLALFGGFTGSGTDIVILALKGAGQELISAVYWGAVTGNFVDKIISCILVSFILKNKQIVKLIQGYN